MWKILATALLPIRDPHARPHWISLGISVAAVALTAWLGGPVLRLLDAGRLGSISGLHFEAAVNWIYCGRYGETTSAGEANRKVINLAEVRDPAQYEYSLPSLLTSAFGEPQKYCTQPAYKTDLSEPGMILVDAAALTVMPDVRLRDLPLVFAITRLAMIAIFGWCFLAAGASAFYVVPLVSTATYFTILPGGHALYSHYPFILPLALLLVSIGFLVLRTEHTALKILGCAALGLCTAVLGNLRTSQYPLGFALLIVLLVFEWMRLGGTRRFYTLAASGIAAFLAVVVVFDLTFIAPLRAPNRPNRHVIAHSLVIGLGTIENDLARREGIKWDDAVGFAIAKRMDPTVEYLDAGYEPALFKYYWQLWRMYPWEMAKIYLAKLQQTSADIFRFLADTRGELFWTEKDGVWTSRFAAPVKPLSPFLTVGGILLLAAASGLFMARRNRQSAWFIAAIATIGFLGFMEAAIILSAVVLWYTPVMVFATVAAGLLPFEYALMALSIPIERRWNWMSGGGADYDPALRDRSRVASEAASSTGTSSSTPM